MHASDVGIALVVALSIESAAMRLMVDDLESITISGDPNLYCLGTVPSRAPGQPHRVVLAQQTRDGTRDAAAIVSALTRSFPHARQVVMPGVAGGVPSPDDPYRHVRLGDIVTAAEGLVDYGHVFVRAGGDELRRAVSGISAALLRADRALEAQELAGRRPWQPLIDGTTRPVPSAFRRPPPQSDVLIMGGAQIVHPDDDRRNGPAVRRGVIGSADQLMQSEQRRDEMARRYGIQAVEMEGSGLAVGADLQGIHWYVVRGVVDYCDARKNHVWHPYAALAAAAYTRALLAEVPPVIAGPGGQPASDWLGTLIAALLTLPELVEEYRRRMLLAALPDRIRTQIADNPVPRLHVLAIVQTCERFPEGQEALIRALRLVVGDDSPDLDPVIGVIRSGWPPPR